MLLEPKSGGLSYDMNMYYGPTDYQIFNDYDRNLDEAMPLGWGIFGVINKYIIIPLFGLLSGWLPAGIAIIVLTILIKLFLLFVVYKFLWPNVMPKVFPGCASNPTFIQVVGLMVIAGVLM